jgi:XTP/dITP diphosphohydrolase
VKILVATHNPGKLREFAELLAGFPVEWVSLDDVGIVDDIEETGVTFEENARLKASGYASQSGLLTFADDSGLEIDALNGEPGVYSARYGGPGKTDADRVELVLGKMKDVPEERRTARFRCVIAVASPEKVLFTVEGVVEGLITHAPRGTNGFGYDPIFLFPDMGKTTAELSSEVKNRISHRGRAVQATRPRMEALMRA